jgi:hypothetical protein
MQWKGRNGNFSDGTHVSLERAEAQVSYPCGGVGDEKPEQKECNIAFNAQLLFGYRNCVGGRGTLQPKKAATIPPSGNRQVLTVILD